MRRNACFRCKGSPKLEELRREEKRLRVRIEVAERKNQLLKREEEDLRSNPDYVEKVAREKLGLIKPNEGTMANANDPSKCHDETPADGRGLQRLTDSHVPTHVTHMSRLMTVAGEEGFEPSIP